MKEASAAKSLSTRLFAARLDLVRALDEKRAKSGGFATGEKASHRDAPPSEDDICADSLKTLQEVVAGLNRENFIVRQHRRAVEKYEKPDAWKTLDDETRDELLDEIAPLPSARGFGTEEAKRFDLLMFTLQLACQSASNFDP